MSKPIRETVSSKWLREIVAARGVFVVAGETQIHFTQIWKYATGRTTPKLAQAAKLHRTYRGRVPILGWVE